MRLTDTTEIRLLANGFVAAYEPGKPAALAAPVDQFPCGDLYHGVPAFTLTAEYAASLGEYDEPWFPESPSDLIQTCTAPRVAFDNGSACTAGHRHYSYVPA